jgi:hypothetical protein
VDERNLRAWDDLAAQAAEDVSKRVIQVSSGEIEEVQKERKRPDLHGPFLMELAGLEPATSWVRFRRKALPQVAMSCHMSYLCGFAASALCGFLPVFAAAT